ncbi:uncharacterized protein LOC128668818 isoform X2 [Microplitis demolitor]|uniref:uncharacterized protein LOC128668818 isoform X2 n=1 Tax=Microplitis demolitor TaxID=69319 RepID=UPI00235B6FC8|nr:uncharacterized protein LOC128668818 isoform X2 [Microplitis demolitor]
MKTLSLVNKKKLFLVFTSFIHSSPVTIASSLATMISPNKWTFNEEYAMVRSRLLEHGTDYKFNRLRDDDLGIWEIISQESILVNGKKDATMCRDRFFDIIDDFLVYFNMSDRQRMSVNLPAHYMLFQYYLTQCDAVF